MLPCYEWQEKYLNEIGVRQQDIGEAELELWRHSY